VLARRRDAPQPGSAPLSSGDLISSGTLTNGQPIAKGETWQVELEGLPLPNLALSSE